MLRNREFRRYAALLLLAGLVGLPLCFAIHPSAGWVTLGLWGMMLASSWFFTCKRYREIANLSEQLSRIAAGNYTIAIGQYAEGELSILASDILKITSTLMHQAEALEKDKSFLADSLADISHQIKTPLTSISMLTELLETPDLPEEKRMEFLCGIRTSMNRIQWLITSLLKLSRLDAGAVILQSQTVFVSDLIEKALSPLRIPIELKGQSLHLEVDASITCIGDLHWFSEAIGNLIKNCMEHTPEGGSLWIRSTQTPLYTELQIADNGPGIPEKDLPHIFERFYRGENASPDRVGIGLALSQTIFRRAGGVLQAANLPQGGACFTVKLYGTVVV